MLELSDYVIAIPSFHLGLFWSNVKWRLPILNLAILYILH
jgi:hypothetical protein